MKNYAIAVCYLQDKSNHICFIEAETEESVLLQYAENYGMSIPQEEMSEGSRSIHEYMEWYYDLSISVTEMGKDG